MNNLDLWNRVSKTNPKDTKKVNQRGGFTAIDAYSQIKAATEVFGGYGQAWGISEISHTFIPDTTMCLVVAKFFYPDGEFMATSSIFHTSGKGYPDDDFAKKVETDIITKSLSRLGFNADVFMGKFDDNRYVQKVTQDFASSERIEKAAVYYKGLINEDDLEKNHQAIKDSFKRLSIEEAIDLDKLLHDIPEGSKKKYKNILKEYLNYIGEDNGNEEIR